MPLSFQDKQNERRYARGIKSLINDSVEKVEAGSQQVNDAVTQMDQVTQQNAALAEESAAAAQSLKDQAEKLAQAVSVFKLAQGETRQVIAQAQASAKVATKPAARVKANAAAKIEHKPAAESGEEWKQF